MLLKSVNVAVVAALFNIGAAERPKNLGVIDYVRRPKEGLGGHSMLGLVGRHALLLTCEGSHTRYRRERFASPSTTHTRARALSDKQGGGVRTLGLCPPSPNCISTAEELNDIGHFAPPL